MNNALSQEDIRKIYEEIKNDEKTYKKKPLKLKYRIAKKNEKIITVINGVKETENTANEGSYIISGVECEEYVLSQDVVSDRYDIIDDEYLSTKEIKIKAKVYSGEDLIFKASWNENMILRDGDFLVKNKNEFYRIDKNVFFKLYEAVCWT